MRSEQLGRVQVPVVGQGTWLLEMEEADEAVRALQQGIDLGMTHIDTAEMYGAGDVEEVVGRAIAGRRKDVYLVSKVLPHNAWREGVLQACSKSLKRLGTDYLDLYLLHWPSTHPLEETLGALKELVEAGKIRAFGVSNFDVENLEAAYRIAGKDITCNQVMYHLQERRVEHKVVSWCNEHDVALVAYSPLGQGDFPAEFVGGGALEEIAEAHGASRQQVALAFLLRHPRSFVIPKATLIEHVKDNAKAGDLQLSAQEIERLSEAFPVNPDVSLPTT